MISRFYLKDYISFDEIDCEFEHGLIVFSGASGAGKSILMNSILSLFGNSISKAKISETTINNPKIFYNDFMIEKDDEFTIKQTTGSKTRYFLNSQTIAKKQLQEFTKKFSKHLHLKDTSDFDSNKIIDFLDLLATKEDPNFKILKDNFTRNFKELENLKFKLAKINDDESNLDDLIEFTKSQIDKISIINPKIDELDNLQEFKSKLSKKDKIDDAINNAKPILENSHYISELLHKLDIDSLFFDDTISEVENQIEKYNDSFENLDNNEIEQLLTRIEDLNYLEKKYGSIEDALEFKRQKELELESYDNIVFEKAIIEKNIKKLIIKVEQDSLLISKIRTSHVTTLQDTMNYYLKLLYLDNLSINISTKPLDITGCDTIEFKLNEIHLKDISSGEFNRLRLALLTARSKYELNTHGILFLDEIDANLSGKESASIAKVLTQLSKYYQIFAISHQPQLTATANQHFLVSKENETSNIKELGHAGKINEIARMISDEHITPQAKEFATQLLEENK